jgi:O-antigen/teichoic acid export membrane protein
MNSTFKPALLLMAGRIVAFAATFFIPIVLVRIFDQAEFGTYKQIFLVYGTLYNMAQFGMAESLFYFLPLAPHKGGRYIANSILMLAATGLVCLGALTVGAPRIAHLLGNAALTPYIPWMGVYLLLTIVSAVLEIVMTSRKRFVMAASVYAFSELLRAAAFIVPVLLIGRLEWLLAGAIAFAAIRLIVTLFHVAREFGGAVAPDLGALKSQLAYALPFAMSSLLADVSSQFHQYAVSYHFDAATFAIYAVGCLQIPLVELVHSPVSNVMMVRMGEEIRDGRSDAVLPIWHDTTRKLALVFFPMLGLLLVTAREVIVLLFTENYLASVPIFMIWSTTVLLPVLQTDSVLRVYAQIRFLLAAYAVKLLLTVALIHWFFSWFQLSGAALITVLAAAAAKAISLIRFKGLVKASLFQLLPWKSLALNGAISILAGVLAMLVKSYAELSTLPLLFVTGLTYGAAYLLLAFALNLITREERSALVASLHRFPTSAAKVGQLIKGL